MSLRPGTGSERRREKNEVIKENAAGGCEGLLQVWSFGCLQRFFELVSSSLLLKDAAPSPFFIRLPGRFPSRGGGAAFHQAVELVDVHRKLTRTHFLSQPS